MSAERDTAALLNEQAVEGLYLRVRDRLRALARVIKRGSAVETDHLVDGAFLKLFLGKEARPWKDSEQFFAYAACAMRQELRDHWRKHRRTQALEATEALAAADANDDRLTYDDLSAYLVEQLRERLHDDPVALRVLQRHLFDGDGDEGPVEVSRLAQELGIAPHDAYRARKRGLKVLQDVLQRQLHS